jgi:5'-3' exonuclease
MILNCYVSCVIELSIMMVNLNNNEFNINNDFFSLLIDKLASKEESFFRDGLPYYNSISKKRVCNHTDDYNREIWNLDNMKIFKINDPINLGIGIELDWQFKYYYHYFNTVEHQQECINNLIYLYLQGILWVGKYYFETCPDYMWQYPYDHAPFISDIAKYLKKNKIDINSFKFNSNNTKVSPMIQLLAVLPPESNKMLAKSYRKLVTSDTSPIIDLYPKKTKLDMLYKDQYWQCIPKLPILDIDRIIKATNKKKLNDEEKKKNKILKIFIF